MAVTEKEALLELLNYFATVFQEIPDDWAKICYEDNFTNFEDFSQAANFSVLQTEDVNNTLIELSARLLRYEQTAAKEEVIWEELKGQGMDATKLVVFLWYLLKRSLEKNSATSERETGIIAARALLALWSLNGATAFRLYNDIVCHEALGVVRLVYRLLALRSSCGTGPPGRGAGKGGKPAARKGKTAVKKRATENDVSAAGGDEPTADAEELSKAEEEEFTEKLKDSLESLFMFLKKVSINTEETSLAVIDLVRDLQHLDFCENLEVVECNRLSQFQDLKLVCERCIALMSRLVEGRHGVGITRMVYEFVVMPRLIMWNYDNTPVSANSSLPRTLMAHKDAILQFVRLRVQKNSEEELEVVLLMLKTMCCRCPDRAEYRTKVVASVCDALQMLPPRWHYKFANFAHSLAKDAHHTGWRTFGVELIARMLVNIDFQTDEPPEEVEERDKEMEHSEVEERAEDTQMEIDGDMDNTALNEGNDSAVAPEMEKDASLQEPDKDAVKETDAAKPKRRKKERRKKRNSNLAPINPRKALPLLLLRAWGDKAPAVRTRAIQMLADLLVNEPRLREMFNEAAIELASMIRKGKETETAEKEAVPPECSLLDLAVRRCSDPRPNVRKAALNAVASAFPTASEENCLKAVDSVKIRCFDSSLMVRKQAVELVCQMADGRASGCEEVARAWIDYVLPLALDREDTVVKLAAGLITERISWCVAGKQAVGMDWRLLRNAELSVVSRRLMRKGMKEDVRMEAGQVAKMLMRKVATGDADFVTWMLVEDLARVARDGVVDPVVAANFWFACSDNEQSDATQMCAILNVIAQRSSLLNENCRARLKDDLMKRLLEFKLPVGCTTSALCALAHVLRGTGEEGVGRKAFDEFMATLLESCHQRLDIALRSHAYDRVSAASAGSIVNGNTDRRTASIQHISSLAPEELSNELVRVVTCVGDVSLMGGPKVGGELWENLKLVVASNAISERLPMDGWTWTVAGRATSSLPTDGRGSDIAHGAGAENGGPAMGSQEVRSSQGSVGHIADGTINVQVITRRLRAATVVAMGKICATYLECARMCVPVLMRQLKEEHEPVVRNNIFAVLCDLCSVYAWVVYRYGEVFFSVLDDASVLLRKQAIFRFTSLLKEEYIRWEGQLMFRMVLRLLDSDESVRKFAKLCLVEVLLVQFPCMFSNFFVHFLFYFNCVPPSFTVSAEDDADLRRHCPEVAGSTGDKCHLTEPIAKNDRMSLYKFMIKKFNDTTKFATMYAISEKVFMAVVQEGLALKDRKVASLLEDCFDVLCLEEMRIENEVGKPSEEGVDDDVPEAVVVQAKKVIAKAFRQGIVDRLMPSIVELKYFLQKRKFPNALRMVFQLLRLWCRIYSNKMNDFFVNDPTLKDEIEFDLRREEEEKRNLARRTPGRNRTLISVDGERSQGRTPARTVENVRRRRSTTANGQGTDRKENGLRTPGIAADMRRTSDVVNDLRTADAGLVRRPRASTVPTIAELSEGGADTAQKADEGEAVALTEVQVNVSRTRSGRARRVPRLQADRSVSDSRTLNNTRQTSTVPEEGIPDAQRVDDALSSVVKVEDDGKWLENENVAREGGEVRRRSRTANVTLRSSRRTERMTLVKIEEEEEQEHLGAVEDAAKGGDAVEPVKETTNGTDRAVSGEMQRVSSSGPRDTDRSAVAAADRATTTVVRDSLAKSATIGIKGEEEVDEPMDVDDGPSSLSTNERCAAASVPKPKALSSGVGHTPKLVRRPSAQMASPTRAKQQRLENPSSIADSVHAEDDEASIAARAVSTPTHSLYEVTFRCGDLSAIINANALPKQAHRAPTKPRVEAISEEESSE